jgi:hypothetical protein
MGERDAIPRKEKQAIGKGKCPSYHCKTAVLVSTWLTREPGRAFALGRVLVLT